jgi:transcriptional regulator with XRE-family HTH domain
MSMVNFERMGMQLKLARVKRGWTQNDLHRVTGIWQRTISEVENGQKTRVTFETVTRLAKALGVKLDDLVTGNGESPG